MLKILEKTLFLYFRMEYLINNLFENKWDLTSFIEYRNDDGNNDDSKIFFRTIYF